MFDIGFSGEGDGRKPQHFPLHSHILACLSSSSHNRSVFHATIIPQLLRFRMANLVQRLSLFRFLKVQSDKFVVTRNPISDYK